MFQRFTTFAGPVRRLLIAVPAAVLFLLFSQMSLAQTAESGLWVRVPQARSAEAAARDSAPLPASLFLLNEGLMRYGLAQAPRDEWFRPDNPQAPVLALPLPDGSFADFRFFDAPLMEPGLARRYPEIKTYRVRAADGSGISGRAALTPLGFHAMLLTPNGPLHVVPISDSPQPVYASLFERDFPAAPVICQAGEVSARDESTTPEPGSGRSEVSSRRTDAVSTPKLPLIASGTELRTYRIAVATTSEYYFGRGGTDLNVLASIIVELLRVVAVYEPEVAISFVLIQDTDMLFFTDPDAYLNDGDACDLKDENQGVVDGVLADADYDVSIVLDARSNTSGGCASGSGVCVSGSKARVSSGLDTTMMPGHEGFGGYRLMSHELGHIFGAGHTWSGQSGNCTDDQFSPNNAYEPGSGTTIMSYSGTCGSLGSDNIQSSTGDPYFHIRSIDRIVTFSTTGNGDTCAQTTMTGNQPPTVDAGPDFTIPRRTPFVLSGTANDPDGDSLTYTWEQFDLAADRFALGTDDGVGPIIRSRIPGADSSRTIPPLSDLFSGMASLGELLPQVDRSLTFRLTARDNLAGGGGVNDDTMLITVDGPPFAIVSPNGAEVLPAGCSADVLWNVGGGDVAATIDLDLTSDAGASFQSLASGVANDGSYTIGNIGCTQQLNTRMRASAVGNIFFDVSDGDFAIIQYPPEVTVSATGGAVDGDCVFEVTFEATVTDDCGVSAADVEVEVDLLTANATLGVPTINIMQVNSTTVAVNGSVLVSDLTDSPARVGVTVTATDNCGNETSEADIADVVDTTPPTIDVSLSPDTIFPPNHELVDILATVEVEDNCDPSPDVVLLSVVSDEPENAEGDGNTAPDIVGAEVLTADFEFQVRAERMGSGDGRTYTAEYGASDDSGNTAEDSATVFVPKSNKGGNQP